MPPMGMRCSKHLQSELTPLVLDALEYAFRVGTKNGTVELDKNAMMNHVLIGLFGYHTEDGTWPDGEQDACRNPKVLPQLVTEIVRQTGVEATAAVPDCSGVNTQPPEGKTPSSGPMTDRSLQQFRWNSAWGRFHTYPTDQRGS